MRNLQPVRFGGSLAIGDERGSLGSIEAILDILGGQHRRPRNRHCPQANQPQHSDPPLRKPRSDDQHPVTALDADLIEKTRRTAKVSRKRAKSDFLLRRTVFSYAPQGERLWALLCPTLEHV